MDISGIHSNAFIDTQRLLDSRQGGIDVLVKGFSKVSATIGALTKRVDILEKTLAAKEEGKGL